MLDLSKPLGEVDGLTLFGDHEQPTSFTTCRMRWTLQLLAGSTRYRAADILPGRGDGGGAADLEKPWDRFYPSGYNASFPLRGSSWSARR